MLTYSGSSLRDREDAYLLAFLGRIAKEHLTVDEGEQRVVSAHPYVLARSDLRAAMADNDRAGPHHLAVAALHAEPLPVAVAAIARATDTFFMSHSASP